MSCLRKRLTEKNETQKALIFLLIAFFGISLSILFAPILSVRAAGSPQVVTYQGKLLVSGASATTSQNMFFVMYDAPTGGTALYTANGTLGAPTSISVTPVAGLFTVLLGDTGTNPLDPSIYKNNSDVYLEVRIGAEILSPRKRLTASPYSFNSKYLDGVAPSTNTNTTYIPVSDAAGDFNFNQVTSTRASVNGMLSVTGNSYFGNIASGTWNGVAVATTKGGTGINSSGLTGFAYISSGNWGATTSIPAGSLPGEVMLEGENISLLSNNAGYITSSAIASSTYWNQAYSWGDHSTAGYVTSSFVPSGMVSGSGSAGQVSFWNSANSVTGTSTFVWDDATGRLGVGTASPLAKLHVAVTGLNQGMGFFNGGNLTAALGTGSLDPLAGSVGAYYNGNLVSYIQATGSIFLETGTAGTGNRFSISNTGNIQRIRNVFYSWPANYGAGAGSILQLADGSGTINWASTSSLGFDDQYVNITGDTMTGGLIINNSLDVNGTSTFYNIMPAASLSYSVGASSSRFKEGWFESMNIGSSTWKFDQSSLGVLNIVNNETGKGLYVGTSGNIGVGATDANSRMYIDNPQTGFDLVNMTGMPRGVRNVQIIGNFAYLYFYNSDTGTDNFGVLDITDPLAPVLITSSTLVYPEYFTNYASFAADGSNIYIGATNDSAVTTSINIYDVSSPSSPVLLSMIEFGGFKMHDIVVHSNNLYVARDDFGGTYFEVYDITSPSAPLLVTSTLIAQSVNNLSVDDNYAYIAENDYIQIIDLSNVANVAYISLVHSSFYDAKRLGDYLYVTDVSYGIRIFDVTDPMSPVEVNPSSPIVSTHGKTLTVGFDGSTAYVIIDSTGFEAFDISSTTNWTAIGYYPFGNVGTNFAIDASHYIYLDAPKYSPILKFNEVIGATPYAAIFSGGKVGIGTDAPSQALSVVGAIESSGGVYLQSAVPADTANALYNDSGTLYWNGASLASSPGGNYGNLQYNCGGSFCGVGDSYVSNYQYAWGPSNMSAWWSNYGVALGGNSNNVYSDYSAVIGGQANTVGLNDWSYWGARGGRSVVLGGYGNTAGNASSYVSPYADAAVVGGMFNTAQGERSFVGGGYSNYVSGINSVSFGYDMDVWGDYSFGVNVSTTNGAQFLTQPNTIALMGGRVGVNKLNPSYALDVTGDVNISGQYRINGSPFGSSAGSIGQIQFNNGSGGFGATSALYWDNTQSSLSVGKGSMVFGSSNGSFVISENSSIQNASYSFIGGGFSNVTYATSSVIGGGYYNRIYSGGYSSFIAGGDMNEVYGSRSAIAGGLYNVATGTVSFIGGGLYNSIIGSESFIAGGRNNYSYGVGSFIAGSYNTTTGQHATALGMNVQVDGDYSFGLNVSSTNSALISGSNIIALMGGNVGVGTTTPDSVFSVSGNTHIVDGSLLVDGTNGVTPVSGEGTRLMWVPNKSAFRAGMVTGTHWDDVNIGTSSFASGLNNVASGELSFAAGGMENTASGTGAFVTGWSNISGGIMSSAFGGYNVVNGGAATAFGAYNSVEGAMSIAFGGYNTSSGDFSVTMGISNEASAMGSVAVGAYNSTTHSGGIALGAYNFVDANMGTALGYYNQINNTGGIAFGNSNILNGTMSVAIGSNLTINGDASFGLNMNAGESYTIDQSGLIAFVGGYVGINTTTSNYALTVDGDLNFTGALRVSESAGNAGDVLVSTGSGAQWVSTSSLGIVGGGGVAGSGTSTQIAFWDSTNSLTSTDTFYWDNTNGRLGIGNSAPEFKLTLGNDGGIMATGTFGSGATLATAGAGTRMIWYPRQAAFRAGYVSGAQWDTGNVGPYSTAFGSNAMATGTASFAMGAEASATGDFAIALGLYSRATANAQAYGLYNNSLTDYAVTIGRYNTSTGQSVLIGGYNQTSYHQNVALGYFNTMNNGSSESVVGHYNTVQASFSGVLGDYNNIINSAAFSPASEYVVGANNYANATDVAILGNRNTTTPSSPYYGGLLVGFDNMNRGQYSNIIGYSNSVNQNSSHNNNVFGRSNWFDGASGSMNATVVGELNNIRNGSNYSYIFGSSNTSSGGSYGIVLGHNNSLSSNTATSSFVLGSNNTVTFTAGTAGSGAIGSNNLVNGAKNASIAIGLGNIVYGYNGAIAMGSSTRAEATTSIAIGSLVRVTGEQSMGLGNRMTVTGPYVFAVNVSTTNNPTISSTNTIVLLGGNVGIGTTTPNYSLSVQGDASLSGNLRFGVASGTFGQIVMVSSTGLPSWVSTSSLGFVSAPANVVTGTGATGQVTYWNGTNAVTGNSNLFWNNGSSHLGVVSSSPNYALSIANNIAMDTDGSVSAIGAYSTANISAIGAGSKFVWSPLAGSLVAGYVSGNEWNAVNPFSAAFGYMNTSSQYYSFISGRNNSVTGGAQGASAIVGGRGNYAVSSNYAFLGGGYSNSTTNIGTASGIIGGQLNYVNADYSAIVAGESNRIAGSNTNYTDSVIVGGSQNLIDTAFYASAVSNIMGGGSYNTIYRSMTSAIIGGSYNMINGAFGSGDSASFILGGNYNKIDIGAIGGIIGGAYNYINQSSVIVGGTYNTTTNSGWYSATIGSTRSSNGGRNAIIAGGTIQSIGTGADYSAIIGGSTNTISGLYSFIGGGSGNTVSANNSVALGSNMTVSANYSFGINVSSTAAVTLSRQNTIALMGGNVGIGTTTPSFRLSLDNDGGVFAHGTLNSGAVMPTLVKSLTENYFIYQPKNAALRVGSASSTYWDEANIGAGSIAVGLGKASGAQSQAFGYESIATASQATAFGYGSSVSGAQSFVAGFQNSITGFQSAAFGGSNTVSGNSAFAAGYTNTASGNQSAVFGSLNIVANTGTVAFGTLNSLYSEESFAAGMGNYSSNLARFAFLLGVNNTSTADLSFAAGFENNVSATQTIALGTGNTASGILSMVVGRNMLNSNGSSLMVGFSGVADTAEPALFVTGAGITSGVGVGTSTVSNGMFTVDAGATTSVGIYVNGKIIATGDIQANSADIAERYPIDETCAVNGTCPEAGDVVCLVSGKKAEVAKCTADRANAILGVVSTDPGFVLGGQYATSSSRMVALAGRVPIKISTKNGPINVGDRLTVSEDESGVAVKASRAGEVTIGIATEDYDMSDNGLVVVAVNLGYYNQLAVSGDSGSIVLDETNSYDFSSKTLLNVVAIISPDDRWTINENGELITRLDTSTGKKEMYSMQSPQSEFVFSGTGVLSNGEAVISFDSQDAEIIDATEPIKVNITLTSGEASGVFVSSKNSAGFTVKELNSGSSNASFDWMVIAKRRPTSAVAGDKVIAEQPADTSGSGESGTVTNTPPSETTVETPPATEEPPAEPVPPSEPAVESPPAEETVIVPPPAEEPPAENP